MKREETRRVVVGGCLDEERERQGEWLWEGVWMKRERETRRVVVGGCLDEERRDKESGCGRVFG